MRFCDWLQTSVLFSMNIRDIFGYETLGYLLALTLNYLNELLKRSWVIYGVI